MMAEPLAAALHGVAKHYHGFTLGPLNLEIPAGSIVGLIGENGAGKTTLLKLLTGVNRPDAGTVELLSATPDDAAVRAKIGVVFEDAYFYESLTPAQVGASLRGIFGPAWDAGYFAALLEQFHLPPKKSIKELSRGMRKAEPCQRFGPPARAAGAGRSHLRAGPRRPQRDFGYPA